MSLDTGLFFPVLLLTNGHPHRHCSTFRIMCDRPIIIIIIINIIIIIIIIYC